MQDYRKSCAICENGEALCEVFHKETSLSKITGVAFASHISRAFDDECFISANKSKREPLIDEKKIGIPLKSKSIHTSLFETVVNRKSTREFTGESVSFENLSTLLGLAYGRSKCGWYTVPSAGGNYPIKLIIIINNVDDLQPGIYEYYHENNTIVPLYLSDKLISYENISQSLSLVKNSAFSIHFIGTYELTCYKYQDRGYRFMNIECGHIAQNLSLISEALSIGAVCSGGFLDGEFMQELRRFTNKDFESYVELYEMFFGMK